MRRYIYVILALLAVAGKAFPADKLEVLPVTVSSGSTAAMSLALTNADGKYTALQADLYLPDGMELLKENGEFKVELSRVAASHSITISLMNGFYRLILYSMTNEELTGTSGKIITLTVKVDANVAVGEKEGSLKNIKLVKKDNSGLEIDKETFTIEVASYKKGDSNADGEINVADVVAIVNYILGKPSANFVLTAADVNEDGEVNVADIVKIVSIILSTNNARQRAQMVESKPQGLMFVSLPVKNML